MIATGTKPLGILAGTERQAADYARFIGIDVWIFIDSNLEFFSAPFDHYTCIGLWHSRPDIEIIIRNLAMLYATRLEIYSSDFASSKNSLLRDPFIKCNVGNYP